MCVCVEPRTLKIALVPPHVFIACTQERVCEPYVHMQVWLLIFETTLITKKKGGKNCTTWPKAIKGTLISLAIMLWGILNSVISARYIRRKVSGNCFVLLEQRLSDELARLSGRFFGRRPAGRLPGHLYTYSESSCLRLFSPSLRLPFSNKC